MIVWIECLLCLFWRGPVVCCGFVFARESYYIDRHLCLLLFVIFFLPKHPPLDT